MAAVLSRVCWCRISGLVRGVAPPSGARLGEEVWTARENRQKHTYKAADLQINGAQSRAALQALKECTAMGGTSCCVAAALLASGLSLSVLSGRSTGVLSLGLQLGLDSGGKKLCASHCPCH